MKRLPGLFFLFLLAGCAARTAPFPFALQDGSHVSLREVGGRAGQGSATLVATGTSVSSALYTPVKPLAASETGSALFVTYRSTLDDCDLTIYSAKDVELKTEALPPTGSRTFTFMLPLAADSTVWGFRFGTGASQGQLQLTGAGITRHTVGFAIDNDAVTLDDSISIVGMTSRTLEARLSHDAKAALAGTNWILTVELTPRTREQWGRRRSPQHSLMTAPRIIARFPSASTRATPRFRFPSVPWASFPTT